MHLRKLVLADQLSQLFVRQSKHMGRCLLELRFLVIIDVVALALTKPYKKKTRPAM
ncbi:hypothetical protein SAMN05216403_1024 [Nitrosospira multiformis ATCC 25196]|uniref:Uncharacterized protein n=1 Tax=Nitrosospira multiformis (strain ATCC 25196 / NCIMB 11849 / C 71) TaxID=323848 RepID=A0A1H5S771_NITMU|nr:hypothetical protein [Nitrosospira multiformis]SEF45768.1 hypothetical protein SAMN05216403_1024 [Nitrosospira multiformis ATCC 25196]